MNHVSVSPTNGNGPTQEQRKTLTRVGIEPTTFGLVCWLNKLYSDMEGQMFSVNEFLSFDILSKLVV